MQHSPVERTTLRTFPAGLILFDDPSLKRFATDLLSSPDDPSGYVSGTVSMVWDRKDNCQMIFKIDASSDSKSSVPFDVIFAGECFDAVSAQGLKLCSMDKLDLALEGAVIDRNILEYKAGVRMKVVKSWKVAKNNGRVIDTWLLRRHKNCCSVPLDPQTDLSTPRPKFTADPVSAASAASVTGGNSSVTSTRPILTSTVADSRGNISFLKPKRTPEQMSTALGISSPDSISLLDDRLTMTAELNFGYTQYVALGETAMMVQDTLINVIGIVKSVSEPSLASNGRELFCTIKILDPSLCSPEDSTWNDSDAFNINCFTKKYKHWLPRREVNDIVIFRDIKVVQCSITMYKKETGEIDHNRGDAPLYEGLGLNGLGVQFSPFHNAQPQEIDYCSKLSTWWRAILEKRQAELGTIHQIGEETPEHGMVPSTRRVHKLIRDADHKVLSKSDNGSYYELYVTDYTKNDEVIPMRSKFWPSSLAETMLKIKMWDAALPLGRTMEQGRIYRMKNVRMILGRSGGLEAKIGKTLTHLMYVDRSRERVEATQNCDFEWRTWNCSKFLSRWMMRVTDFDIHLQKFLERKELWKSGGEVA
ncbi:hypothetical protein EDD85DRAFT_790306 [Armillaria nabsnona]|nr:hypothetical protein EDD85DRAFT_790306 [Armillaria nabsnona]